MEKKRTPEKFRKKALSNTLKYSGIAFQMIAIILTGVYAGIWLDEKVALNFPLFKLVFSLFSVALAMYIIIRQVSRDK